MAKTSIIDRFNEVCANENGLLTIIRMDDFAEFTELYGEDMSEMLSDKCKSVIRSVTEDYDTKACLGGDEFVIFCKDLKSKSELTEIYFHIVKKVNETVEELTDGESTIYMGISMGAVMVPEYGTDYEDLFEKADMVLDFIKDEKKHSIAFYDAVDVFDAVEETAEALEHMGGEGAMMVDHEHYVTIREFFSKYVSTYKAPACEFTFFFTAKDETLSYESLCKLVESYGVIMGKALRKSDVVTVKERRISILLPELTQQNMFVVVNRIEEKMIDSGCRTIVNINFDSKMIGPDGELPLCLEMAI